MEPITDRIPQKGPDGVFPSQRFRLGKTELSGGRPPPSADQIPESGLPCHRKGESRPKN